MFDLDDWTVVGGFAHNMCWYRRGECVVAATIDASTLFSMPNCNRLKDSVAFIIVAVPPTRIVTNFEANIFLVQEVIGRCELFLLKIFYSQVMTTITHKILLFPLLSWAHLSNTSQSKSEHSLLKWFFIHCWTTSVTKSESNQGTLSILNVWIWKWTIYRFKCT